MIKVVLDNSSLRACMEHAREIVEHYSGFSSTGSGSYNHNNVGSNLVGIKSEMATKLWLKDNGCTNIKCEYEKFRNPSSKGDLVVFGRAVEVKGLRPQQWADYKRCIPPRQLDKYILRNAIVVWTTTSGDIKSASVFLRGWNYATDVKLKGTPLETICSNIWLKDDEDMRLMDTLINAVKNPILEQAELPLTYKQK